MTAARLRAAFPALPAAGVIGRDYASFTAEQRALVMELLLAGRFHLAVTGELLDGRDRADHPRRRDARELAMLGVPRRDPAAIRDALEAHLAAAVERVRDRLGARRLAPLSLAPLHLAGPPARRAAGCSITGRATRASGSTFHADRPRRFDPRTLPPDHADRRPQRPREVRAGARRLVRARRACAQARRHPHAARVRGHGLYDIGVAPPVAGAADLILIDGELRRVPAFDVAAAARAYL